MLKISSLLLTRIEMENKMIYQKLTCAIHVTMEISHRIGNLIFYFKISPLDGSHLKVSCFYFFQALYKEY